MCLFIRINNWYYYGCIKTIHNIHNLVVVLHAAQSSPYTRSQPSQSHSHNQSAREEKNCTRTERRMHLHTDTCRILFIWIWAGVLYIYYIVRPFARSFVRSLSCTTFSTCKIYSYTYNFFSFVRSFAHSSCSFQFIVCFLLSFSSSSASAAFRLYCECMKLYLFSDTQS